MVHPPDPAVAGRRSAQHDPRRRRGRHAAGPRGRRGPALRRSPRGRRGRPPGVARRPGHAAPGAGRRGLAGARGLRQGRHRGDHHRRPPPLRDVPRGHAAVPGHQRQRLGHQVQVRQQVRLPALPHRRHQPGHRRPDRRQGGRGVRLRRRGQGLRRVAARPGRPRHRHRGRPHLRPAGRDGRLPGGCARLRRGAGGHLHHRHRLLRRHHRRRHGQDEAPGHRRQHRPLRQRDRHGWPGVALGRGEDRDQAAGARVALRGRALASSS